MTKIKITQKSTGKSKVVSPADAEAIKSNPLVAKRYKFEDAQAKPSEPSLKSEDAEVKTEAKKQAKPTTK